MTEEQVFLEFMSNFADKNKDGKITRDVNFLFFINFSRNLEIFYFANHKKI